MTHDLVPYWSVVTKGLSHWLILELRHFLTPMIGQGETIDLPPQFKVISLVTPPL